jgi:hypothetical protein
LISIDGTNASSFGFYGVSFLAIEPFRDFDFDLLLPAYYSLALVLSALSCSLVNESSILDGARIIICSGKGSSEFFPFFVLALELARADFFALVPLSASGSVDKEGIVDCS